MMVTSMIRCIRNLVLVDVVEEVHVVTAAAYKLHVWLVDLLLLHSDRSLHCTLQQANVPRPPMRGRAMQAFALPVRAYGHGKLWET